jgi:hypothetical protein
VQTAEEMDPGTPLLQRAFTVQIEPAQIEAQREHFHTLALPRGSASFHDVMLCASAAA